MDTTEYRYMAFTTGAVEVGGEPFHVRVHWAQRNGRMVVVGLDLRTFFSEAETNAVRAILQGDTSLHFLGEGEVNTSVLRGLKPSVPSDGAGTRRRAGFADLVEESRRLLLRSLRSAPVAAGEETERSAITEAVNDTRRRPGPKPHVSEQMLVEVVAPAYLSGGRTPVAAVREALAVALGERVSREQASKAVQRARNLRRADGTPLIPEATRRKK